VLLLCGYAALISFVTSLKNRPAVSVRLTIDTSMLIRKHQSV